MRPETDRPVREKQPVLGWRPDRLARHSSLLLAWMLLRAAAQAAIVLLLARKLGATDYGRFVAIIAVGSFVAPFVGLGLSSMVLRNGAMDPAHLATYLARAVRWWLLTLIPGVVVTTLLAVLLLPSDGLPMAAGFAAVTADLAVTSLTELRARHRQAQHRIGAYGAITAGLPAIRLTALCLLFATTTYPGTEAVLWIYAASSLTYALLLWPSLRTTSNDSGAVEPMSATSGLPFSTAAFAMKLQGEFNKPALAHLGFDLTGTYSVAQRANDLASMPLTALQESMWPRLYAHHDPMGELRRIGSLLLLLSLACCVCIWLTAPLLPVILGSGFEKAVTVMRSLALLPLLQSFRSLLNFHAIHHGRMPLIGRAYVLGAATSVAGVTMLVPTQGMSGAVLASYASEAAMIAFLVVGTMRPTK